MPPLCIQVLWIAIILIVTLLSPARPTRVDVSKISPGSGAKDSGAIARMLESPRSMPEVTMQDLRDEGESTAPSVPSEEPTPAPKTQPTTSNINSKSKLPTLVPLSTSKPSIMSIPTKDSSFEIPTLAPTPIAFVVDKTNSQPPKSILSPDFLYLQGVSIETLYLILALIIGVLALLYYLR
jgi:hypothetical protein